MLSQGITLAEDVVGNREISATGGIPLRDAFDINNGGAFPKSRDLWLQSIIDQIPDLIYVKDLEGHFLFANHAIVANNGLSRLEDLVGRTDFDFLSAEVAQIATDVERMVAETGQPHFGCEELAFRGDDERWLMISRVPFRDEEGRVIGVIGVSRDITAQKSAARLKDTQSQLLEMIARGVSLPGFLDALSRMISELSDDLHAVFLSEGPEGEGPHYVAAPTLNPEYRAIASTMIAPAIRTDTKGLAPTLARTFKEAGISDREYQCACFPILSDGRIEGILALHSPEGVRNRADLAEFIGIALNMAGIAIARHRAEARIGFLADHDPLTGMANRMLLDRRLRSALQAADAAGSEVGLAFLDLDNFKLINDSLGHSVGDQLLKVVANRVCELTSSGGSLARIGGDEFVIIFEHMARDDYLSRLSAIRDAVARPISFDGVDLRVTCSIGVASYPDHGKSAEELLAAADMAMYRAKELGRDGMILFDLEMAADVNRKVCLAEELRQALDSDEFVLHFQPQVDARTGKVLGAEALIRWNHPAKGLVYPGDFIALAEETGQIVSIGDWVLRSACRQAKAWQDMGLEPLRISVNVSARQFQEKSLIASVAAALEESRLDPEWLELEITESMIMKDLAGSIARMHELKALGIMLAVDDFGTGYSNLSALKRFPLSRLKIDRSFIIDLSDDPDDMAITSAIISLAQKLGLDVIAEGVETERQAEILIENGCHEIQGYLYSRPVKAELFAPFLRTRAEFAQVKIA
jgi:diguanylate cyclase (GGDEF)-like protein/PAS domain S-box-containing protein